MIDRLLRFFMDPRRAWIRTSASAAASALCIALAVWLWYRDRTWAERAVLPLSSPLANLNQPGVNVDLAQYEPSELERALGQIEQGGFLWMRQRFPWNEIEPQRGVFEWATWDAIVAACAAHHLKLVAVLDGTPPWARPDGASDHPLTPPQEMDVWGAFVARFADRYQGRVAAYQLWDEPNLSAHWGNRYVDPVAYAALLREGAIRARTADPQATILLAALAPTIESGPLNLNEVAFLRQVVQAGGEAFFDVVALQPYGFDQRPEAGASLKRLSFVRAALVRREMVRMGLGDRPVWATAYGWNALPPGWEGQPSVWSSVSEGQQVDYTLDALRIARQEWPWMGPMFLYTYQPDAPPDDPRWGFALVDVEGAPRPLYDEVAEVHVSRWPLHVGAYAATPENAEYGGVWRFSKGGSDPPRDADLAERSAVVAFDIQGTSLDLTVRRGGFWGVLYVEVGGRPANALPRDERGRAYLVLYDPSGPVETVTVARGLSPRTAHHVEIVAHGGWGQWPLVGWTVRQDQAPPPGPGTAWLFLILGVGMATATAGQIAMTPHMFRPLYASVGRVFRWYRALPEPIPVLVTVSTALAFYWVPWTAVSLPLAVLLFVLFFLRIDLGLAMVAFALPFYLKPKPLLGRPVSVVELGVGLCVLSWLFARLLDLGRTVMRDGAQPWLWRLQRADVVLRQLPLRLWREWTGLDKGIIALVLIAALSLNWAAHRDVATREFRTVFLESAIFYALVRLALRSPRAHRRLLDGWLLGATTIAAIGIGQAIAGQNLITAEGVWRVRGFYGSPNNLALYLERAFPMLLALTWKGAGRDRFGWARRTAYAVAGLIVLIALVLTMSKGALFLGVPAALLALGLAQRNRRATWTAVGAVAVLGLLILPFAFTERFRALLNPLSGTGFFRLKLWRSTLAMIADHPLAGVGLDNFLYFYRSRYVLPSAWGELNLSQPHNLLLDAWTRLGIGGVAAIAWLFVAFFRAVRGQLREAIGDRRALLLGFVGSMAAMLAHGLVDHAVFLIDLAFVFGLMLALVNPRRS